MAGTVVLEIAGSLPEPANENLMLMSDGITPAEFMQWLNRTRDEMRREFEADFRLRSDPTHRKHWDELNAMDRCARWHLFGERG